MKTVKRSSAILIVFTSLILILTCVFSVVASYGAVSAEDTKEAKRYFDRGTAAVEMASSDEDYEDAIHEFEMAIELDPSLRNAYYNLALVQEKAGKYEDALENLEILLKEATDEETEEIETLKNKIEYKIEKRDEEWYATPATPKETYVAEPEKPWTEQLNGRWVGGSSSIVDSSGRTWYSPNNVYQFQVSGNTIVIRILAFGITNANNQETRSSDNYLLFSGTITGNNTSGTYYSWSHAGGNAPLEVVSSFPATRTISLSADGNSLDWGGLELRRE